MLKLNLSLFLFFLSLGVVFGQEQLNKKYQKFENKRFFTTAYIVKRDSSREEGLMKYKGRLFHVLTFVHKDGKKEKYYPNQIAGFGYYGGKYESVGSSFYKIVTSGPKATLYKSEEVGNTIYNLGPNGYGTVAAGAPKYEVYYVKKAGEETFKQVRRRKFVEEFTEYFGDCEKVKAAIEAKELKEEDIYKLVKMYNFCR